MNEEQVILAEHRELVQLYIHQEKLRLNTWSLQLILNLGLISTLTVVASLRGSATPALATILCFVGVVLNLLGYISTLRITAAGEGYLRRAAHLEAKMGKKFLEFEPFSQGCVDVRREKTGLRLLNRKFQATTILLLGIVWGLLCVTVALWHLLSAV